MVGACAAAAVLVVACSEASDRGPGDDSWAALLDIPLCGPEVATSLDGWGAAREVLPAPPTALGTTRVRVPTGEIGEWILLDLSPDAGPVLTRLTPGGAEQVTFDSHCEPTRSQVPKGVSIPLDGGSSAPAFDDAALRATLASTSRPTVVYVWSPHMPLSVDGYREIVSASEALDLQLTPVLFPGGDRGFAQREAARVGIPEEGLRELASIELEIRDAEVHAPTILVFGGRRISRALPGYRSAAGYRSFLRAFLEEEHTAP